MASSWSLAWSDCALVTKHVEFAGTHMGKVLVQCGQSEEARAAAKSGIVGRPIVLPRSNVPEDMAAPQEDAPAGEESKSHEGAKAESKPEVRYWASNVIPGSLPDMLALLALLISSRIYQIAIIFDVDCHASEGL